MSYYITLEDVRNFVQDRDLNDNELQLDLTFSDEEIMDAMKRSAREYNSISPFVGNVQADQLCADTNMFLDAIAYQLYLSRHAKLARNDMDYAAGSITTNIVQKQLAHFKELIPMHQTRFERAVKDHKLYIQINSAWGQIG